MPFCSVGPLEANRQSKSIKSELLMRWVTVHYR